jgi:hypothetical protein
MSRLAADTSNYTDRVGPAWDSWPALGLALVLPQAISPPPGYPSGRTAEQCRWTLEHGLLLVPYVWKWFALGTDDIRRRLDLLTPFSGQIDHLVLDVEDTSVGLPQLGPRRLQLGLPRGHLERLRRQPPPLLLQRGSTEHLLGASSLQARIDEVAAALEVCDAFPTKSGLKTAVYTGRWFWGPYMGDTSVFSDRPLMPAEYDGVADPTRWSRFGGWSRCALKQYQGSSSLGGVGGIDLSVMMEDYLMAGGQTDEPVQPIGDVDWPWQKRRGEIVELGGQLKLVGEQIRAELERRNAAGRLQAPRRKVLGPLATDVSERGQQITG